MTSPILSPGREALRDLLTRVEAATGPLDPETVCRIHALGQTKRRFVRYIGVGYSDDGGDEHSYEVDDAWRIHSVDARDLPDRSLDAAAALVERAMPGAVWHIMTDYGESNRAKIGPAGRPSASVYNCEERPLFMVADAETPPLALCAALILALIARAEAPNP